LDDVEDGVEEEEGDGVEDDEEASEVSSKVTLEDVEAASEATNLKQSPQAFFLPANLEGPGLSKHLNNAIDRIVIRYTKEEGKREGERGREGRRS